VSHCNDLQTPAALCAAAGVSFLWFGYFLQKKQIFSNYPIDKPKKVCFYFNKETSKTEYLFGQSTRKGVTQSYRACKMAASYRIRRSGSFYAVREESPRFDVY